ncbi:MAG: methylmalonyl-CoA epimerase [Bacteroidota bacterium]|nr:methylmalonyl-CoA epimerase [Bacteroidota bacterium]
MKLEHIGIAVRDINASLEQFRTLFGAEPYKVEEVASEGVRTYFFDAGGSKIELLEATTSDSPIAKYLDKQGPGLHHLAFSSEDIHADWDRLSEAGYTLIGEGPKAGADGKSIFFVHPRDTEGVLTEFCF